MRAPTTYISRQKFDKKKGDYVSCSPDEVFFRSIVEIILNTHTNWESFSRRLGHVDKICLNQMKGYRFSKLRKRFNHFYDYYRLAMEFKDDKIYPYLLPHQFLGEFDYKEQLDG